MSDLKVMVDRKDLTAPSVQKAEKGAKGDRGESGLRGPSGADVSMTKGISKVFKTHFMTYYQIKAGPGDILWFNVDFSVSLKQFKP